ncbi:MAG: GatB/YqeY domain-containing protein [Synergistaceae bacterium]
MPNLVQKIQDDMVSAMKSQEVLKLSVLRMLKAALQLAQVEKGKDNLLNDEDVLVVIRRLVKQRKEAAEMYKTGGALDRADSELAESVILEEYLPAQLSDEELAKIVADVVTQVGATSMKDMGKVMGRAVAATKGSADGNRIKEAVQKHLSSMA